MAALFGPKLCLSLSSRSVPTASNFISQSSFASTMANSSLPPPTKKLSSLHKAPSFILIKPTETK